jgi:hypothetical protein
MSPTCGKRHSMPLSYGQPEAGLARELREVARDAIALETALTTGLNFELPPDFPRHQLVEITKSLAQLPSGTAEGSRPALEYARNRIPAIRREHVLSEELDFPVSDPDAAPQVVRGALIDERLRHLIASVTTALDEYRRLAAEEAIDEVQPEAGVVAPVEIFEEPVAQSLNLETGLDTAAIEVAESVNPKSPSADNLKRQLSDGQGLNRLARAELRMPKVIVTWYRWIIEALKEYPSLISNSASNLKVGADIVEIGVDRWHNFQHNTMSHLIDEFRQTCDAFGQVAEKLEERRRRRTAGFTKSEDEFDFEVARAMILVGRVPPAHWLPSINDLAFGTRRLGNLSALPSLTYLRSLTHVAVRVTDLTPLAGLVNLEDLDLWGTWVHDVKPLAGLLNLKILQLGSTQVTNLSPLASLINLQTLVVAYTSVKDISPLAALINLQHLDLRHTGVIDVSPLATLVNLRILELGGTKVRDLSALADLKTLTIRGIAPAEEAGGTDTSDSAASG